MSKVTYIESGGEQHVVDVPPGLSLMEAAVQNSVPGIAAICGGRLRLRHLSYLYR